MVRNRRLIKGVVAGAAGVALLVGGGTFALWHDAESVASGSLNSGELDLDLPSVGTWTNQDGAPVDPATYLIVPGDVLTLTQPLAVTATGDTLEALLSVSTAGVVAPNELADALDVGLSIATPPAGIAAVGPNTYKVVADQLGSSRATVTATVTLTFPESTDGQALDSTAARSNWWGQLAQNGTVDLSAIEFDLQQATS